MWNFSAHGVALMYGKSLTKEERGGLKFSEWCLEMFPGICTKNEVQDAIWFAEVFGQTDQKMLPPGLSSPRWIRRWFNEQQAAQPPLPRCHEREDLGRRYWVR